MQSSEALPPVKTYVQDVMHCLNQIAPPEWAMPGDPVGLLVGSPQIEVRRVAVALDPDPRAVTAAIYRECQLLVTHHPLIHRPIAQIRFDDPVGQAVQLLCERNMAHIAVHTNWDCAPGGINDTLAARLDLQEVRPFGAGAQIPQSKLVTFVPVEHLDVVLDAMAREGAGEIGLYRRCAFYQEGTGTYEPQPGAQPFQGEVGRRESAQEYRLEVLVEGSHLKSVMEALLQSHPYEEVAVDVYPLQTPKAYPMGRVGQLPKPMNSQELRDFIAERLGNPCVRFHGKPQAILRTLAVLGGAGSDHLQMAKEQHADALLTGEVRHHHTWEAFAREIVLFEGGHLETERPGMETLAARLQEYLAPRRVKVLFI